MDLQAWASFLTMLPAAAAVQSIVYKIVFTSLSFPLITDSNTKPLFITLIKRNEFCMENNVYLATPRQRCVRNISERLHRIELLEGQMMR